MRRATPALARGPTGGTAGSTSGATGIRNVCRLAMVEADPTAPVARFTNQYGIATAVDHSGEGR